MLSASKSASLGPRSDADMKDAVETLFGTVRNAVGALYGRAGGGVIVLGKPELTCEITFGPDPRNDSAELLIRRNGVRKYSVVGQMLEDGSRWCGYKVFVHRGNGDAEGTELDFSNPENAAALEDLLGCLRSLKFGK